MAKKELIIKVSVGDGCSEEEFVEYFKVKTDKTPKDLWTDWDKCKDLFRETDCTWCTSDLVIEMKKLGYKMRPYQQEVIELEG